MTQQDHQVRAPDDGSQSAADRAAEKVAPVIESAHERASETMSEAGAQTRELVDQARSQVRSQANAQTRRVSEMTRDFSDELRSMAEHGDDSSQLTSLARDGAQRLDRFSTRLDQRGLDGTLEDVKRFARRRPGVFLAACAGAGFMLGRLMHNTDSSTFTDAAQRGGGHDGNGSEGNGGRHVDRLGTGGQYGSDDPSSSGQAQPGSSGRFQESERFADRPRFEGSAQRDLTPGAGQIGLDIEGDRP